MQNAETNRNKRPKEKQKSRKAENKNKEEKIVGQNSNQKRNLINAGTDLRGKALLSTLNIGASFNHDAGQGLWRHRDDVPCMIVALVGSWHVQH